MGFGAKGIFDTGYSRPLTPTGKGGTSYEERTAIAVEKLVSEYITPHVELIYPGFIPVASSAVAPTLLPQPIFSGTVPITRVLLQAIAGTLDVVFGPTGDISIPTHVRVTSSLPAPFVMPWSNEPCKVWVRNPDTAVVCQFSVILLSAG